MATIDTNATESGDNEAGPLTYKGVELLAPIVGGRGMTNAKAIEAFLPQVRAAGAPVTDAQSYLKWYTANKFAQKYYHG